MLCFLHSCISDERLPFLQICDDISKKDFLCKKQAGQLSSHLPNRTINVFMVAALPLQGVLAVVGLTFTYKRGLLLFNNFGLFFTLTSTNFVFSFCRLQIGQFLLRKQETERVTLLKTTRAALRFATGIACVINFFKVS